ncbi:hypothetical protein VPH35_046855 [Triticum aestivum]
MTTATGGIAPAPPLAASPSKLPNAARPKKGKTSAKKNKAADGFDTSKARRKKLAGRVTDVAATEASASSLVEPPAGAHNVFDDMPQSVNNDAYMSTMGVGSNNSHWYQTNDMHFEDHEFEVDEDVQHCTKLVQRRGEEKRTKKGKIKKGRIFTLPHCYEVLKDDEKWKKRDDLDDLHLSNKCKRTIELNDDDDEEEDASSDDGKRSPTPNSVSYSKPKRPDGCKKDTKEKKKRKGDDKLKNTMKVIVKARKDANEMRKMARNQDAVTEERRLAAEERKVALKERKVSNEERTRLLEWEKHLFFLDTSILNEAQKEYVNLAREEVLIQKRAMIRAMGGGGLGAMGGMSGFGGTVGGLGAMGGFGATMKTMEGMDGFGAPPDAMAVMGGMSFASLMGGMGAPPSPMGGMSSGVPPHTHSHKDVVEDLANTVRASRDVVRDEEEEEESSSEEEESSSKDEDEDEDEA